MLLVVKASIVSQWLWRGHLTGCVDDYFGCIIPPGSITITIMFVIIAGYDSGGTFLNVIGGWYFLMTHREVVYRICYKQDGYGDFDQKHVCRVKLKELNKKKKINKFSFSVKRLARNFAVTSIVLCMVQRFFIMEENVFAIEFCYFLIVRFNWNEQHFCFIIKLDALEKRVKQHALEQVYQF